VTTDITDIDLFKQKALQWAARFDVSCYLDSNGFNDVYGKYDLLIAAGAKHELKADAGSAFNQLDQFRQQYPGWLFGYFTYDLKNETERLSSGNIDQLQFPDLYFFVPEHVIIVVKHQVTILSATADEIFSVIQSSVLPPYTGQQAINLQPRFGKTDYVKAVKKIQQHIIRGDVYVTNFCQEFFTDNARINPANTFHQLNELSPTPFACFFKQHQQYALCASPERFLAKRGNKLISQPIKGTAKRQSDSMQDEQAKYQLQNSIKERQENVMVVDLVRNDLTHSAKPGTVQTEELFSIYSFRQVHQMISTVVCEMEANLSPVQAIKNTFPMGSMTGAPKISSMQLMEHFEQSKRGLYSGAIGYFSPDGDFDFNVVIRSLLYNAANKYLSLHVGSAITYDANAEQEYEECLLKASAMFKVLGKH